MNQSENIYLPSEEKAESVVVDHRRREHRSKPRRLRWRAGKSIVSEKEKTDYFWSQVNKSGPNGCREWLGTLSGYGYGLLIANQKHQRAHIFSYVLHKGPTNGLCVCHTCDNRICVNPDHLWLGTIGENIKDMYSKGRQNPQKGTERPLHKLTDSIVREIRKRFTPNDPVNGGSAMGREFGVSEPTISNVVHGRTWKHVTDFDTHSS